MQALATCLQSDPATYCRILTLSSPSAILDSHSLPSESSHLRVLHHSHPHCFLHSLAFPRLHRIALPRILSAKKQAVLQRSVPLDIAVGVDGSPHLPLLLDCVRGSLEFATYFSLDLLLCITNLFMLMQVPTAEGGDLHHILRVGGDCTDSKV